MEQIRRVPAWSVTVAGALIVAISVALGPMRVNDLEETLRDEHGSLSGLKESHLQAWNSHTTADARAAAADTMAASIEHDRNHPRSFRLGRAGYHIEGAIRSMWASTGATDDSELNLQIEPLRKRLNEGDLNAYDELGQRLNVLRLESAEALNAKATQIGDGERRIRGLEQRLGRTRRLQASLNVVGLVIVLLAELPIWRRRVGTVDGIRPALPFPEPDDSDERLGT